MLLLAVVILLAASSDEASLPPIGIIDFYGLRTIPEIRAREVLGFKEGDSVGSHEVLEPRIHGAKRRLETSLGVPRAELNLVCCEGGRTILYVGIEESATPADIAFSLEPKGAIRLPLEITQARKAYDEALGSAVERGEVTQDWTSGHTLSRDAGLRAVEERFVSFAARDEPLLRDVLHHSADADDRALATQVLAYVPNKGEVVADLVEATRDPADEVRNNAMRALGVMAYATSRSPEIALRIPAEPFVARLNSILWTDRNKASLALSMLTESGDGSLLDVLCRQALPALVDMARWKASGHALGPFQVLGRIARLPDEDIASAWDQGKREEVIAKASTCAAEPSAASGRR